jgi:hypothetical protein
MKSRPLGLAPRDVKCPSSPGQRPKRAAHASPCMFSRLERDVESGCFLVYFFGVVCL